MPSVLVVAALAFIGWMVEPSLIAGHHQHTSRPFLSRLAPSSSGQRSYAHIGEVRFGDDTNVRARALALVREPEQRPNLADRKSE